MAGRPRSVKSKAQKEIDQAEAKFEKFNEEVKALTMDRMNEAPKVEAEPQTKLSSKEIDKSKELWIKPKRTIYPVNKVTGERPKFNERFRKDYEFAIEYVHFIAQNNEIIGETITMWTLPFPGMPAEEWEIPTNKPLWAPRHVAETIKKKRYHRLRMEDRPTDVSGAGTFYGHMTVDTTIQRLDAHPVNETKSIFMGASGF